MAGLATVTLVLLGLGSLLPRPDDEQPWLGVRFLGGYSLLIVGLYLASAVGPLPLPVGARVVAGAAAIGWLLSLGYRGSVHLNKGSLVHPVIVLPVAVAAVAAASGGLSYEPVAWDEVGNWLLRARSAVRLGHIMGPEVETSHPEYPPGWSLALAFPNLLLGRWREADAAPMQFLMHVGLLGAVWDVVVRLTRRHGIPSGRAAMLAWVFVLAMLAVEATWRLVPTSLLIEKPQIYSIAALCVLSLLAAEVPVRPTALSLQMGLLFAASYLLKVAVLAFAPALLLAWVVAVLPNCRSLAMKRAAACGLLLPPVIVYVTWRVLDPGGGECMSNPVAIFRQMLAGESGYGPALDLAWRLTQAVATYIGGYKPALTAGALAAMIVAVVRRPAAILLPGVLFVYLTGYFLALYLYHLFCFGDFYFNTLNSIDRFTRVPLRIIHLLGPLMALTAILPMATQWMNQRRVRATLAAALVALGGWQVRQVEKSLTVMSTRQDEDGGSLVGLMNEARAAMAEIVALRDRYPGLDDRVLLIDQGSPGTMSNLAGYAFSGILRLEREYSWGETRGNPWMAAIALPAMRARLLSASIIWPHTVDPWMLSALTELVDDEACRRAPTRFLLIAAPDRTKLICIPRTVGG
jgi:hypothetical protein